MAGGDGINQRLQMAIYQFVERMELVLSTKPVTTVNISAFGFSRGAIEARLNGTRDILNFVCLKLIYGNDYFNIPKVNEVLDLLKNKK